MNDEIREILDNVEKCCGVMKDDTFVVYQKQDILKILNYITNLQKENERLKKEVAKLHIIQEEYGSHIENTHIIDDYQKTYFMTNKWLIELKDGRFVDINVLNSYYEDYKSRMEKAVEYIEHRRERVNPEKTIYVNGNDLLNILQNGSENNE